VKYFWSCHSQLIVRDGILYYKWEDPVTSRYLFVVPECMKEKVFKSCHDAISAGHLGQNKTLHRIKQCAIWHGMSKDCKLYVQNCSICNKNKKSRVKARSSLGQYHAGSGMQRLHLDILGPLPITQNGNKYILMIIDQFSKWLGCFPLPNQHAETVAKTLVNDFISRFGCPFELLTDQGENMDGSLVRQLCRLLDIAKTRTTPYHPASNGQVERYNRIILQTVRCYLKNKPQNWDIYLPQIAGAIRSSVNR
jgi:hypothetical protein